jgi:hypothetical protein
MGLSGLAIYKLAPQDQLQGMRLSHLPGLRHEVGRSAGGVSACPYVSEETKARWTAASAPPIRLITLGTDTAANWRSAMRRCSSAMRRPFIISRASFYRLRR